MSVEKYMDARAAFGTTKAELKALTDTIATVASTLQTNPRSFIFSNQPIGLPMEATMGRNSRSVDAASWPSVEQIMQLLQRYHEQYKAVETAWSAVPQNQRDSLKDPEDLLGRSGYSRY